MGIVARLAEQVAVRALSAIVAHFIAAGAVSAAHAVPFTPQGRAQRRVFTRMRHFGAIVALHGELYYLDERALPSFRKEELARMLGVIALTGLAAAGAIALGR